VGPYLVRFSEIHGLHFGLQRVLPGASSAGAEQHLQRQDMALPHLPWNVSCPFLLEKPQNDGPVARGIFPSVSSPRMSHANAADVLMFYMQGGQRRMACAFACCARVSPKICVLVVLFGFHAFLVGCYTFLGQVVDTHCACLSTARCCCCAENNVCTSTHRHCKAFRYRARRAQNAASKRAAMMADKKGGGQGRKSGAHAKSGAQHKAASNQRVKMEAEVDDCPPSEAMLALLELARERLLQDDDVSQTADGSTSESECSSFNGVGSITEANSPSSREEVSDSETISSKLSTPRLEFLGRDGDASSVESQRFTLAGHLPFTALSPPYGSHRKQVPCDPCQAELPPAEIRLMARRETATAGSQRAPLVHSSCSASGRGQEGQQGSQGAATRPPLPPSLEVEHLPSRAAHGAGVMMMQNLISSPDEEACQSPLSTLVNVMLKQQMTATLPVSS
jgi:hypothetical protein